MDTGTGAVHIAPGHGEDDYSLGKKNGLPILSPVDDHGRFTEEVGVAGIGRANMSSTPMPTSSRFCASAACCSRSENYQHSYPYCWRSKTPIIFRAVEQFFIRIDELRGRALEAIKQVKWIPPGAKPNRRHGRIAARLGHLAPAQLGRAAAGFLFGRRRSDPECRLDSQTGRSRRATRLECLVRARRRRAGARAGFARRNTRIATTRSMSGSTPAFASPPSSRRIPSCAIRPTCISKRPISIAAGFNRRS